MILTHAHLLAAGMPHWDVIKFRLKWPEGCEITPENYLAAETVGLCPDALFSAVCPTRELQKEWDMYTSTASEEAAIRCRAETEIKKLRADAAAAEVQRKCNLLIQCMEGK